MNNSITAALLFLAFAPTAHAQTSGAAKSPPSAQTTSPAKPTSTTAPAPKAVGAKPAPTATTAGPPAVVTAKTSIAAQTAITNRRDLFKQIKKANDPIGAMLKNQREFDIAVIAQSARQLQDLSVRIPVSFAIDTREFKTLETKARPGIWNNMPDFKAKADALGKQAANVVTVAAGGDKAATRKAVIDMSKTCGGCHDQYKDN